MAEQLDIVGGAAERLASLTSVPARERPAHIESLLRDEDPSVREAALRAGAALLDVDTHVGYLRNEGDHVLRNAGLAMLKMRGPSAGPLAVSLLLDADPDVALQAVLLLDHLRDPRSVSALRRVLHHHNQNVVQAAIVALGHTGSTTVIPDLVAFLDAEPWLCLAAIEALGDLGSPAALAALTPVLANEMYAPAVCEAMARIGGVEAYRALATRWIASGASDAVLLTLLAEVAEAMPGEPPPFPLLMLALADALVTEEPASRLGVARVLLACGPTAFDATALAVVADAWPDENDVPRCLVHRRDLVADLLAANGTLRVWGLRLAARWPLSTPREALVNAVQSMPAHAHADAVAAALLVTSGAELGDVLVSLYARLPRDLRATWGPVLHHHADDIRPALLEPGDGRSGAARAVLATVTAQDPAAAANAIAALPIELREEALTHAVLRADVLPLLPWLRWLEEAPETCGRIAVSVAERAGLVRHVRQLRGILERQRHPELVRLLGRLRDVESVPLMAALTEAGPETLRPFLLQALGAIGGAAARAVLRGRCANDPAWARFAFRALASCCTDDDLPVFRAASAHADWHVRMVSVEVLGRSGRGDDIGLIAKLAADPVEAVAARARAELGQ